MPDIVCREGVGIKRYQRLRVRVSWDLVGMFSVPWVEQTSKKWSWMISYCILLLGGMVDSIDVYETQSIIPANISYKSYNNL